MESVCYVHVGPQREISSQQDLNLFLESDVSKQLFAFLEQLCAAVRGKKVSDCSGTNSDITESLVKLFEAMAGLVSVHPPIQMNSRFGNPAFRDWFDAAQKLIRDSLLPIIPIEYWVEVSEYIGHALGNRQRIDYGTGHEAHFLAFLFCLSKLGLIEHCHYDQVVLKVFAAYLAMARLVQSTYWLEPAGSLGVWGLDDYHFLPFLFGAAQLSTHRHLRPKTIHDGDVLEAFSSEYLYYDAICQIIKVKGPQLYQHSPMLDDISAVKTWQKVEDGLKKMYRMEVFGKLPVMQHFLFGRLIHFKGTSVAPVAIHEHRGDCCGNPLPSAFPAAQDNVRGLPSLPFD